MERTQCKFIIVRGHEKGVRCINKTYFGYCSRHIDSRKDRDGLSYVQKKAQKRYKSKF